MKRKLLAAALVGVATVGVGAVPAQALWSQLADNRVGFWTRSYGDLYGNGRFGGYRAPGGPSGLAWGYVLPDWLDYPKSIWNRTDRDVWVYENPSCMSAGGRWVKRVAPGQKVNSTTGTDWDSIQAFSYLAPTPGQRSCD
jgi:hypothetical protein